MFLEINQSILNDFIKLNTEIAKLTDLYLTTSRLYSYNAASYGQIKQEWVVHAVAVLENVVSLSRTNLPN